MYNLNLNKLSVYKDELCARCGRKYPDTILNIEGMIHHHCELLCLDKKDCEKAVKKKRKSKG
jgi:hypothetical protein